MKQTLLTTMLLLCALMAGGSSAWAEEAFVFDLTTGTNATAIESIPVSTVTVSFALGTNKNGNAPTWYSSGTALRFYAGNTITITSTGSKIKKIVLTNTQSQLVGGDNGANYPDDGTYSVTGKVETWTATTAVASLEITITNKPRLSRIEVYLEDVPATITSAKYATFSCKNALDFSETGITVYTAEDKGASVGLNEVTSGRVPANTPVVLYKADANGSAIDVPVIPSADDITLTNNLAVSDGSAKDDIYVLAQHDGKVGFYKWAGAALSAGKVYLKPTAPATARDFLGFDETTAVESVKVAAAQQGDYYNLAGQRVANPTKGLYIVNGKKVIIK